MKFRFNLRNLLAAAILVFASILVVMTLRNFQGGGPEEILETLPRQADLSLQKIHYTETRDGVRHWTLVADSAAHSVGEGATRLENVRVTFYGAEGVGDVVMTARRGEFNSDRGEVEAIGDVVIQSPQGYAIHTERLQYRQQERLIRTEEPVRLESRTMQVTGRGMRFNIDDRKLTLLSTVTALIESAGEG